LGPGRVKKKKVFAISGAENGSTTTPYKKFYKSESGLGR